MKVYFRREIQHNYLVIEPDNKADESYEIKMLTHNTIEGLLKFRVKRLDGEAQFFYDITSKQPLSRIWESREITAEEIRILISTLAAVLNRIEVFLFLPERLLIQAEYIYVEPESLHFYFCLLPNREADFFKELQELLYFLLKKVKHQNQESVVLAYGLYQETQKENYGMGNLLRFLGTHTEKEESCEEGHERRKNMGEEDTIRKNKEINSTQRDFIIKNTAMKKDVVKDTTVKSKAEGSCVEEKRTAEEGRKERTKKNQNQPLLYLCMLLWIGLLLGTGILYWQGGLGVCLEMEGSSGWKLCDNNRIEPVGGILGAAGRKENGKGKGGVLPCRGEGGELTREQARSEGGRK
ncbi:MAG: DUF6382 domain-containing protein [bacterium]|nr:DUF6382 domain-containing protein [bacterium]